MLEDEDRLQAATDEDLFMRPMVSLPVVPDIEEEEPEGTDSLSQFDLRHREPFLGLLYLGALKSKVTHFGHSFQLETPTQREKLEAGVLHKRFVNTVAGVQAWTALTVALYLVSVDDTPLPEPIGPSTETKVQDRFNWVVDNLKSEVINRLFEDCLLLDAEVVGALEELETQAKR